MRPNRLSRPEPIRTMAASLLIGVGLMAAIDEIIFHQLLGWHHFYDLSTPMVGLISDGFLHAAELIAIVAGFFLVADLQRHRVFVPVWGWAGFFLGAGGFQLFDGIVDHKILRIHQVRYGVELLPYDVGWNLFGVMLLLIGVLLTLRARGLVDQKEQSSR